MFWFSKKSHSEEQVYEQEKRERLFFHDLINQTHGLLLFLNQRQSQKQQISLNEITALESEVRTLQSLIKDHFNYKHKNLAGTYDWVPFRMAETALSGLIETYLPKKSVHTFIHLEGSLSYECSVEERESSFVYFPVFYRIMNNLIKNMSEAKSTEVHFTFAYGESGFLIETKNKINGKENLRLLSDKLAQIILEEKPAGDGLGLESIHHLVSVECGGTFTFEIANDLWINRILLPLPIKTDFKKAA